MSLSVAFVVLLVDVFRDVTGCTEVSPVKTTLMFRIIAGGITFSYLPLLC